ncbi:glycosyltransferase involved in cell wall biosynthesis [Effusibacillus lacus]|nr:glycosyltransferase involved in cell wall biosynthesis [Effusibacillus lacus]
MVGQVGTPRKVLYMIGGGEFGGAEQHLLGLVKSLDPAEWAPHVAVFYNGEFANRLRELKIPVTLIAPRTIKALAGLVPVRKIIREMKPDILHTHGVRSNLLGRLANQLEGHPAASITTIHSILSLDYPVRWKRILFGILEKSTWPLVDHFILVSRSMKESLMKEGLPEKKASVIHNAIELPKQPPARPEVSLIREELGLSQDAVLVGTVARLHKVKGHTYLIQAILKLKEKYPNVHYVWVGGGEMYTELKEEVQRAGLADVIHFLGARKDVPELLPQFDLFVLPSVMEGFGLAALEAQMSGIPVIATAVGGLLEVIEDGRDGLLVSPQDPDALAKAMDRVLSSPDQFRLMARTGQEKVFQYGSLERLIQETTDVYIKVTKKIS